MILSPEMGPDRDGQSNDGDDEGADGIETGSFRIGVWNKQVCFLYFKFDLFHD